LHKRWFERLLAELKFELWIGDPARIKAARVRKQKSDRQDAQLLLRLLVESRFPQIWVPSPENRDLRPANLASASPGADAHVGHEPNPGCSDERGSYGAKRHYGVRVIPMLDPGLPICILILQEGV
jgi:hypothetical protein